ADLAIALDPDADRCALGIRGPDGWRMLRGDETGTLLAEHILPAPHFPEVADAAGPAAGGPLVATTIVSSTLLGRIAAARGARHRTTLTGFKWLVRAGDGLVYAYEEALGICVDPDAVRDKDGISAAVALCRMVAGLRARERTVADELNRLAAEFGVHAGTQVSVRVQTLETIRTLMEQLRSDPPRLLARTSVTSEDLLRRDDHLHTDALVFEGGLPDADRDGAGLRLVIRPSGTEPKIKAYLEVTMPPADDVESARARAAALLDDAASDVRRMLASASG
ncbi:MAG: phospho-sugar mutase, partial [Tomitella sp.]|nr:phospho-sugar mutase [Tomitella sp.]